MRSAITALPQRAGDAGVMERSTHFAPAVTLRLTWVVVLRGFAAMWVYAYHLWHLLGGMALTFGFAGGFTFGLRSLFHAGYQGVDLFFVLSGFVIAWPYVQRRQRRLGRYEVADFYQRRYFRIAPIFYVNILVVVILIHLHWLQGTREFLPTLAHFFFFENFYPDWVGSLRAVYWTLPTEMHFYLLFPLLLPLMPVRHPLRFAAACVVLAIAYRGFAAWGNVYGGMRLAWTAAYLPGRIDQFACGMAAACMLAREGETFVMDRRNVVIVGALAVVGLVWIGRHEGGLDEWFIGGPSAAAVLIAVFLVALGRYAQARGQVAAAPHGPLTRAAAKLGEASLGIYLWHTVFLDLAVEASQRMALSEGGRAMLLFATIPVTIAVSLLTWKLVEARWVAFARSAAWRSKVRDLVARNTTWWPQSAAEDRQLIAPRATWRRR
jgi:peptidoglycan/LPS O-acetylase OafA/YrhL